MKGASRSSELARRAKNDWDIHGGLVLHSDRRSLVDDDGPGTGTEYDPPRPTGTSGERTAGPLAVLDELGDSTALFGDDRIT